ncbi:MAG TPA: amino acid ABC transporter permease [Geminicoccus sp.]|uniref:amino acid ABC transporter permease n=1 Tax=Geminicoccus sp. TaxID=2024832 RepID=UPI002E363337|nr:amino acid ABC transporter permease [Geminicoccus sp.]HEX2526833.1 amino acid ABC transporter permease [Geminicoccus sp.]
MAQSAPRAPTRPPFWNDPRVRSAVYQVVAVAIVVAIGAYLVQNTIQNLQRLGVSTGFGFLSRPSGFDVSQTLIPYDSTWSFGRAFIIGLMNTALLAICGIVLATIIGFLVGIGRLSRNWLIAKLSTIYVETLRNIPILLQLIFVYTVLVSSLPSPRESLNVADMVFLNTSGLFIPRTILDEGASLFLLSIPVAIVAAWMFAHLARLRRERTGHGLPRFWISLAILFGLPLVAFLATGRPITMEYTTIGRFRPQGGFNLQPEFVALVLGLSIYTASYIAEIVRSGILAIGKGQTEAAMALGLDRGKTLRLVIIPQALRVIVPPLTSQYLNLTKNSSLGVAVGYPDLFSVAGTINNQTGQAVEVIAITMMVYLMFSLLTSLFMNWYNARIALVER